MKKGLLVIMMSLVMGGLMTMPKNSVNAKAEAEKLAKPSEMYHRTDETFFNGSGTLDIPYEYFTVYYDNETKTTRMGDIATLEIAIYPFEESFDETKIDTYAVLERETQGALSSDKIISALKDLDATPNIEYSAALRYVSKYPEVYADSDWDTDAVLNGKNPSFKFEFDYELDNYGSISVNADGRLVWPWELFNVNNNAQANEIDHMQVLVFPGDTYEIDENSVPLTTFDVNYWTGDRYTNKADIERHLTLANLKPGEYCFSARLIPVEGSKFEPSHLYPLTGAFPYEPEDLGLTNIAKGANVRASSEGEGGYKAHEAVDGSKGTRWQNSGGGDTGWLLIDLGTKYHLATVKVFWEGAYAKDYDIFLAKTIDFESFDGDTSNMKAIASVRDRAEYLEEDEFTVTGNAGRYLIVSCLTKGTGWDYSIYEVEAYVDTTLTEAEKFIDDWKDLRAMGDGNICNVAETDEMTRLLAWYDKLSVEDKAVVDATLDAQGNTIGSSIEFIKAFLKSNEESKNNSQTTVGLLLTMAKENKYTIAIVLGLIALTFVGYIVLNKNKKLVK